MLRKSNEVLKKIKKFNFAFCTKKWFKDSFSDFLLIQTEFNFIDSQFTKYLKIHSLLYAFFFTLKCHF